MTRPLSQDCELTSTTNQNKGQDLFCFAFYNDGQILSPLEAVKGLRHTLQLRSKPFKKRSCKLCGFKFDTQYQVTLTIGKQCCTYLMKIDSYFYLKFCLASQRTICAIFSHSLLWPQVILFKGEKYKIKKLSSIVFVDYCYVPILLHNVFNRRSYRQ